MTHTPARPGDLTISTGLASVARQLRRRRRLRLTIRALWIALVIWSVGPLMRVLGMTPPDQAILVIASGALALGLSYALFSRPTLAQLAAGLDRHYSLDEQLATALEVAGRSPESQVEERLLRETDGLIQRMRAYFARQPLLPWREIETLAAVCLLVLGLTVAGGFVLPDAPGLVALPDLPPPEAPTDVARPEPEEQPVAEEPAPPPLSPQAQAAADAIADALRDNGATRSAADALDRGDTEGAARDLRELADQAEQLGESGRSDVAQGLREAAERLRDQQPGLADRLERQADGLEAGGQEAERALEDLARTVEELRDGEQVAEAGASPGQTPQPGDQAGQESPEQPGMAGQQPGGSGAGNQLGGEQRGAQPGGAMPGDETLPLPEPEDTGGPTVPAFGPRGPQIELGAGGTGEADSATGGGSDQPLVGAADPLLIPPEYRDVVENYFSPRP
jgi:hypothetical protein